MASTLTCVKCGEDKKQAGGKMCENGHFVCYGCSHGINAVHWCPLCGKKVR